MKSFMHDFHLQNHLSDDSLVDNAATITRTTTVCQSDHSDIDFGKDDEHIHNRVNEDDPASENQLTSEEVRMNSYL